MNLLEFILNFNVHSAISTATVASLLLSVWFFFVLNWFLVVTIIFLPLYLCYVAWIFLSDFKTPARGGRAWTSLRKHQIWDYYRDYFPIRIRRTRKLDPSQSYLFGYHPHGILSFGAIGSFAMLSKSMESLFPGIEIRLLTLDINFYIPFHREFLMWLGLASVNRESCVWNLERGNSIVIVIGGATEALYARPATNDLTLHARKGFVRVAIQTGASLVPIFSFGENDLYEQFPNPEGSLIRKIQTKIQTLSGIAFPLVRGRGFITQYGLLPRKQPINTIVGRPIKVNKNAYPTEEEVDRIHQLYEKELIRLYNRWKDVYAKDRVKDLDIIDIPKDEEEDDNEGEDDLKHN